MESMVINLDDILNRLMDKADELNRRNIKKSDLQPILTLRQGSKNILMENNEKNRTK